MSLIPRDKAFLPTTSIENLRNRAKLMATIRRFFDEAGFFEVETPLLSADIVVDAWLEPFVAHWLPDAKRWEAGGEPRYLQTSPEFAMKRLIAAGADSIYQLGKVFRNGEFGQRHNPEFTMVEWYRQGDKLTQLMDFTEQLVRNVLSVGHSLRSHQPGSGPGENSLSSQPFERLTYDQAFEKFVGRPVLDASTDDLREIATEKNMIPPPGLALNDRDGWLNYLLAELVEPFLGYERPTFLTHYPASQAALARLSNDGTTAERFELYIRGVELCNGYDELTNADVLRERIVQQSELRAAEGLRPLPKTSRLLAAMDAGLPPCSGNALGVDRLIMLALGHDNLSKVIPFPFDIA